GDDSTTVVALAIGSNPANGTLSGTTTATAAQGMASFSDLSIDSAGTGYTLTASAEGLTGAESDSFDVTVTPPPPPPGEDVVVFNDVNIFDQTAMADPNNVRLVQNLVVFTTSGARDAGSVVQFDRGRSSACGSFCNETALATMRSVITGAGKTITDVTSTSGSITDIPAAVKVVFLWLPLVPYTAVEITTFKQFAAQGGRIVFIGEWDGFYTATGIATENQFLTDMGAVLRNTGGAVDCGRQVLTQTSLRQHQITTGLTGLSIACASVIVPGQTDFPLFFDLSNTQVLAGVARVDVGESVSHRAESAERRDARRRNFEREVRRLEALIRARLGASPELDPTSPTGRRPQH
ncbi:MAG: hypothetical protein V3T28_05475, partial [Gemmatimonadales bacterium]